VESFAVVIAVITGVCLFVLVGLWCGCSLLPLS